MRNQTRRAAYASLWIFALAFGWIEASVVVYLRDIYAREAALQGGGALEGLQVSMVALPARLTLLEVAREASTIVLLGAVAWLAGGRVRDRIGAFVMAFGVWDLTYYGGLKLLVGWPDSLSTWDILFLIPLPWVAPVWAPAAVAAIFTAAGSHLFWTPERERPYRWLDLGVLAAAALGTIAAFLFESGAALDRRAPEHFPLWLFWASVALGTAWFLKIERRGAGAHRDRSPRLGVRVRQLMPDRSLADVEPGDQMIKAGIPPDGDETDVDRLIWEYSQTRRRRDQLRNEAAELGARLERLGHGLIAHPERLFIGVPDRVRSVPAEWDVVAADQLPSVGKLVGLTAEIRDLSAKAEELRERLILKGRSELLTPLNRFYH
jgi:hypothetical protein